MTSHEPENVVQDLTVVSEATDVSDVWHARVTCRVTRVYEETPDA